MKKPPTNLTATQHEILEVVWGFPQGATVTEIWEAITARRKVTRTTVLNLTDRLDKRGWLKRRKTEDGFRYTAVIDRETTARMLASDFVDGFFGGSASELVMSLLGNKRIAASDLEHLRRLLDAPSAKRGSHKENN